MSLKTSTARLNRAAKGFRHVWQQARSDWRDARALGFEEKYVMLLESCVRTALTALDHMDAILAHARRDCE